MSTRQRALGCYKKLLRTRLEVFKGSMQSFTLLNLVPNTITDQHCAYVGDDFAIKESYTAIRASFEKNKQLTDVEEIKKVILHLTSNI